MGFDNPRTLGKGETGAHAALPIWMDYMADTLKNVPEAVYTMPDKMVAARINNNGMRDPNGDLVEYFYEEKLPSEHAASSSEKTQSESVKDQLF